MKKLTKKDFINAIITGVTAGLLAWRVLGYLEKPTSIWLVAVIPLLWLAGVQLGYILSRLAGFFEQFGKYVAIGFTNFAVDAGVFNLLLSFTHRTEGGVFALQKSVSFIIAVMHSYFWNSRWSFQSVQQDKKAEFAKFLTVNILAMAVNVGTAYAVVHFLSRPDLMTAEVWANIGAVSGSAAALIFSFVGFRLIVFRKSPTPSYPPYR